MAKNRSANPLVNLLLIIIAGLIAVFYALFLPETPVSSSIKAGTQIPLGSGQLSVPTQIQGGGTATGLQQAAPMDASQLNAPSN